MSEPKLISPMLDDFDMGGPISDHNGVRCCPAMRKNSDEKYIVKIISVPESQTKLDALLLTGALADNHAALSYFEELANGIIDEKKILDNLSQLEGFVSFKDCQVVPMDDAVGYDVYLLSNYTRTLERQIAKIPMTQLEAVNLGLDLCAALSACRRGGYLYVDLKPSNIYIVGDKEYKIGDLGFVRINNLKYESLQDKYRSRYTAPELEDVFSPLNETVDIYAAGLILYHIFNGGVLPAADKLTSSEKLDAPAYADDEMAQIILKACDPNPTERWVDPVQMGQAIVSYIQKNGANDTPLTAEYFGETIDTVDSVDETTAEVVPEEISIEGDDAITCLPEEIVVESDNSFAVPLESPADPDEIAPVLSAPEIYVDEPSDLLNDRIPAETDSEYINLSFLDDLVADVSSVQDVNYEAITDEVTDMLDQIDELTSHEVPAPVIAPEPIEIKIPDPIVIDETVIEEVEESKEYTEDQDASETRESAEDPDVVTEEADIATETDPVTSENKEIPEEEKPYVPKKKRTGLVVAIILTVLLALAAGVYFFYTSYYLQPIHAITLSGSEDNLQVTIDTDIDEVLLTVVCADSHGNKVTAPVVAGKSAFSGLAPDTAYTVSVEVEGLHKLTGVTSKTYSTPVQTKIMQVRAITGPENGSIILSFTIDGPDSEQWNVIYSAEGEAERVTTFTDHMFTVTGLTVGKEYMFRLEPVSDIYLSGETYTTYVARNLVCAENLQITSFVDGVLAAKWDAPAGETVTNWSVRCYNNAGYNETVFTEDSMITFQNLDESLAYTIEVAAADMSVTQQVSIAPNAVTVSDFAANVLPNGMLSISWNANRDVPSGGWMINYSINGINVPEALTSTVNIAEVNAVPNSSYHFSIYDNAGNEVLGGPFTYTLPESTSFNAYAVTKDNITVRLCKTPTSDEWSHQDLTDEDYVNTFSVGEKISAVLAHDAEADDSTDEVLVTYAIYNEDGKLVIFSHDTQKWNEMWDNNYCELDVPVVPTEAGTYNMIIYFNGADAAAQKFEILV